MEQLGLKILWEKSQRFDMIDINLNDHVMSSGTLLKQLYTAFSPWLLGLHVHVIHNFLPLLTAANCLFPPEFMLKAFMERVINHSMRHMIAKVLSDIFFSVRSKIKVTRKNHLILVALNWNSESRISCSHFPKVITNWCELLNSLHLAATQAAQVIWLWTAPWS